MVGWGKGVDERFGDGLVVILRGRKVVLRGWKVIWGYNVRIIVSSFCRVPLFAMKI